MAEVEKAVNESGTAIGNEHETYSLPQRIRDITAQRDYFIRQTDKARAKLASAESHIEELAKEIADLNCA